eukprot:2288079-Pleurochrysis_carterae.AAC.2
MCTAFTQVRAFDAALLRRRMQSAAGGAGSAEIGANSWIAGETRDCAQHKRGITRETDAALRAKRRIARETQDRARNAGSRAKRGIARETQGARRALLRCPALRCGVRAR